MSINELSFVETEGASAFNTAIFQHKGVTKFLLPSSGCSSLAAGECHQGIWKLTPLSTLSITAGVGESMEIVSVAAFNRRPALSQPVQGASQSSGSSSSSSTDQTGSLQFAVLFNPPTQQLSVLSPRATPRPSNLVTDRPVLAVFGKNSAADSLLEEITSKAVTITLLFSPVRVTRVDIRRFQGWLVSGASGCLHAFQETPNGFEERPLEQTIPECAQIEAASGGSAVLCVSVMCVDSRRFLACGCSNGFVFLSVCNEFSESSMKDEAFLDGPISSLCFYTPMRPLPSKNELHPAAAEIMRRAEQYALSSPPKEATKMFVALERTTSGDHLIMFQGNKVIIMATLQQFLNSNAYLPNS